MVVTHHLKTLFLTTAFSLASGAALAAFDPMAESSGASAKTLPIAKATALGGKTLPLLYPSRAIVMPAAPAVIPPQIISAPAAITPAVVAQATPAPVITAPVVVAQATPAPVIVAQAAPAPQLPAFPPVDASVAAAAQQQLQKTAPSAAAVQIAQPTSGFIAPAPLLAMPTSTKEMKQPAPVASIVVPAAAPAIPEPAIAKITPSPSPAPTRAVEVAAAPAIAAAPEPRVVASPKELPPAVAPLAAPLTNQSRTILAGMPSKLDTAKPGKSTILKVDRVSPDVIAALGNSADEKKYESVGLSIKVRRPGLDTNYELGRAYTALMGNDTHTAIETYKNILSTQPTHQEALFGLAATYHRLGDLDRARPLYGSLLKLNPNHRDGLNNFLALVSDESPQEALAELERLGQRNPDFSPIPAQQAVLLDKLGYYEESREKMLRAISLAPENLSYKYNLAVMSDRNGNYADASALYRMLIDASLHGATIPAPLDELQQRLNYITSTAATQGRALGG